MMAKRLTRIVTKTGDKGETYLAAGVRVKKDHVRVELIGTVDELNSAIGMVLAQTGVSTEIDDVLTGVQQQLFNLGAELCQPKKTLFQVRDADKLEVIIHELNAQLAELEEFVLPGGHRAAALCHVARTVCRRTERRMVSLANQEAVNPDSMKYINRLSDLLFVVARTINKDNAVSEILWQGPSL